MRQRKSGGSADPRSDRGDLVKGESPSNPATPCCSPPARLLGGISNGPAGLRPPVRLRLSVSHVASATMASFYLRVLRKSPGDVQIRAQQLGCRRTNHGQRVSSLRVQDAAAFGDLVACSEAGRPRLPRRKAFEQQDLVPRGCVTYSTTVCDSRKANSLHSQHHLNVRVLTPPHLQPARWPVPTPERSLTF